MRGLRLYSSLACLAVARAFPNGLMTMRSLAPPIDSDAVPAQFLDSLSEGDEVPPYAVVQYFDQPIDHNDLSLGTFEQRYWLNDEFYEPGGPILLVNGGEGNAEQLIPRYVTNISMIGTIAQQESGAIVLFEHRFFGLSNPYPDLSEESLQYLSVQKNIDDMIYFARNVELPMAGGDAVTPDEAPWVLIGASYAGAVVGWTMHQNPGVFYAGYSSSGVVEAITDFWRYFEPIRVNMPANCSSDLQAAVARIDAILDSGDDVAVQQLKESFGMGNVTYSDDFASAISTPLGYWQSLNPSVGPNSPFFQFCDALEVDANNQSAPAEGWGVDHALAAYGQYFIDEFGITGDETWGTHDGTTDHYTNITIDNFERSWLWIVCNEVGWYQVGAPEGQPTLVSRYVTVASNQLICQLLFPNTFPEPPLPGVDKINSVFGGWDAHPEHVVFVNAINDPWLESTVSSHSIDYQSTPLTPVLVGDGFHHAEVIMVNGELDPILGAIQQKVLGYMHSWLADWTPNTTY